MFYYRRGAETDGGLIPPYVKGSIIAVILWIAFFVVWFFVLVSLFGFDLVFAIPVALAAALVTTVVVALALLVLERD